MRDRISALLVILLTVLRVSLPYEIDLSSSAYLSEISVSDCDRPTARISEDLLDYPLTPMAHPGRADYKLGNCHDFSGKQTVVLFFLDDTESFWNQKDIHDFTNLVVLPGLAFLTEEAADWGVELSFEVKRYSTANSENLQLFSELVIANEGTSLSYYNSLLQVAAADMGYHSDEELLASLTEELGTDKIIPLVLVNKPGRSYALPQQAKFDSVVRAESAVIYADHIGWKSGSWRSEQNNDATVAHEILHLFGAEDYYAEDGEREGRASLARSEGSALDVMLLATYSLGVLRVTAPTAYGVGWTEERPAVVLNPSWYR